MTALQRPIQGAERAAHARVSLIFAAAGVLLGLGTILVILFESG